MSDHRTKLAVVAALALSAGAVLSRCSPAPPSPSRADVATEAAAAPRDLLNRLWFDKLPEKRTDEVTIGLFFGGGIGLFESGSAYKSSFEIFEFERKATELDLTFLHDKKRSSVTYVVRACDERPPFDLCLTLEGNARGPKKLYGFAYDSLRGREASLGPRGGGCAGVAGVFSLPVGRASPLRSRMHRGSRLRRR